MTATAPEDDLHDVVEDRLRRADQRYTSGRRAIIGLLVDAGYPVSIGDIADRLPDLPRSSAYRHLVDLQVAGVVRRVAAKDRKSTRLNSSHHTTSRMPSSA
jgi:Fe2+ or Zn2+ uptake regulation protein